ncbi:hypothetical protein PM10SUCC1_28500 [Propionigenium maris DSM 9537]|uniref:Uncharacterized protein n=1 Tax=Propionigenium maris DSM 9537 TaxID=1123000 RepID=A0A9W6GP68_9FUSO|nr:hypothetical protein [Propionigenium maris]GLI57336.1 hypothetical protein PM10SUCC1_28500 [Propionigenium maris DSM 9537]
MSRPECYLSLELEQRMNLQVRIMTIQDYMRYGGVIDKSDDDRRVKSFGFDKHTEDMLIYFTRLLDKAIELENWNLVKKTKDEISDFKKKYTDKKKSLHELELHYEELDDKLREWLMEYLATSLERTQNESSKIDMQMIRENLNKKKRKKEK